MNEDIYTYITLPVSGESYKAIKHFCEDMGIEYVPERENMCVELIAWKGAHKLEQNILKAPILLENLFLIKADKAGIDSGSVLLLCGESEELDKVYDQVNDGVDPKDRLNEDLMSCVIISSDFEESENKTMSYLETEINEYVQGDVLLEEVNVRYQNLSDITDYLIDGVEPENE